VWPFRSPTEPVRDWVNTGEKRWVTIKEGAGFKRQFLRERQVDLNSGTERYENVERHIGDFIFAPLERVVRTDVSDEYYDKPVPPPAPPPKVGP
jgi:hypothetical protein